MNLRNPVGDLQGQTFLVTASEWPRNDDALLLGVRLRLGAAAVVSSSRPGSYSTAWRIVPAGRSLERVASQRLGEHVRGCLPVEGHVEWGKGAKHPRMRMLLYLVASIILTGLIVATGVSVEYLWWPTPLLAALVLSDLKRGPIIPSVHTAVPRSALQRLRNHVSERGARQRETLAIGQVAAPADLAAAVERVDAVKATYGALISDVIYRVEHSALFDPAVDATREFTLQLARWDERTTALEADDVVELAREIELSFNAARGHAETLGLGHLPRTARSTARRAVKALRTARESSSDGERAAALNRANELLGSLALYYLPDPEETRQSLGGSRPQLGAE